MRIHVVGAGVVGSVFAGGLIRAGHDVEVVARGDRLTQLRQNGLVLQDMGRHHPQAEALPVVAVADARDRPPYSLVLVCVRRDDVLPTLPALALLEGLPRILFLGNTDGLHTHLVDALGDQLLLGFPGVGGVVDGDVVRFLMVGPQPTVVAEPDGGVSRRLVSLQEALRHADFPTAIAPDFPAWLLGHSAFVVPIAYALARCGLDPTALAADPRTLRLMVRATRQAVHALDGRDGAPLAQVPANLHALYRLPTMAAVAYWQRLLAGPKGELWFAGHCRSAPEEMQGLAADLRASVRATGRRAPALEALLSVSGPWALSGYATAG